jgi:hypothetical protein
MKRLNVAGLIFNLLGAGSSRLALLHPGRRSTG